MRQLARLIPEIEIAKLVPRIKHKVAPKFQRLSNPDGPLGRINGLKSIVNALFKYERLELQLHRAKEARGYAERLIVEALRNGDKHPPTMDMANFWLEDKQLIHKLFKVFVPRYENCQKTFTELYLIPYRCHLAVEQKRNFFIPSCVLEMRGHPYPPMPQKAKANSGSLTNILLEEARKEFKKMKLNSETSEKC